MKKFKIFLRASELDTTSASANASSSRSANRRVDISHSLVKGKEIRAMYEEIVGLNKAESETNASHHKASSLDCHSQPSFQSDNRVAPTTAQHSPSETILRLRHKHKTRDDLEVNPPRLQNTYLRCAQEGDLNELIRCVEQNNDIINCTDGFGWTALMCASCAGHAHIVEWLLLNGSDISIINHQGKTARDVTKNRKISQLLKRRGRSGSLEDNKYVEPSATKSFYCPVCEKDFLETTQQSHDTSTLHLFNCQEKTSTTHYFIPPANRGFQMMVKSGWEPNQGLGNEGQGRKFPIKTVLKRDREGLGGNKPKVKKVTHFEARDESAVKYPNKERSMRSRTLRKKDRQKKASKERAKEVKFRREFYT